MDKTEKLAESLVKYLRWFVQLDDKAKKKELSLMDAPISQKEIKKLMAMSKKID